NLVLVMNTLGPLLACMLLWIIAAVGLGLLLSPPKTLPVISRIGLSGVYYDRVRGSLIPMWTWRVIIRVPISCLPAFRTLKTRA
ncbi:MAG TPA: hypothetical protein VIK64_09315, partial [Anaerolineales bacterium]